MPAAARRGIGRGPPPGPTAVIGDCRCHGCRRRPPGGHEGPEGHAAGQNRRRKVTLRHLPGAASGGRATSGMNRVTVDDCRESPLYGLIWRSHALRTGIAWPAGVSGRHRRGIMERLPRSSTVRPFPAPFQEEATSPPDDLPSRRPSRHDPPRLSSGHNRDAMAPAGRQRVRAAAVLRSSRASATRTTPGPRTHPLGHTMR